MPPVVRIVDAGLGDDAPVRLVLAGLDDPDGFRSAWAPSGASIERVGTRLRAISTTRALMRAAGRGLPSDQAGVLVDLVQAAVRSWRGPTPEWETPQGTLSFATGPALMGICNVTPDSFSDGGTLYPEHHPDAAITAGHDMAREGAVIIDVGGESTRPGSQAVEQDEELRRVLPVVEALADVGHLVSIDTRKPAVAEQAVHAGAAIVNDVAGGRDPALLEVVARTGAGYVLMHSRGTPADMQRHTAYEDVVAEVYEYLEEGLSRCRAAGIESSRIAIDPGVGFAKTDEQSLMLIGSLRQFRSLGQPVLLGVSRKSFVGRVLAVEGPRDRLEGNLACAALATQAGVAVLRVHDVAPTAKVVRMVTAVAAAGSWIPPVGPGPAARVVGGLGVGRP